VLIKTKRKGRLIILTVRNTLVTALSKEEMSQLFHPLWQKDTARTSNDNFGLGLSIANALTKAIDAELLVEQSEQTITFSLILK